MKTNNSNSFANISHFADVFRIGQWEKFNKADIHPELMDAWENLKVLTKKSKATNTLKTYESYFNQFYIWC